MYTSQVGKGKVAESIKQIRVGFFITKNKKIHERKEYTNKQEKNGFLVE